MLIALAVRADEGYRLLRDQVSVSTPEQWEAWTAAAGVRVVGEDGTVAPRFLRQGINAALNADRFAYVSEGDTLFGGVRSAGSQLETAALAIDGDVESFWEPDRDSPLRDWFLEMDLGRAVIVERIVVRFAAEGLGDPFLKFRVLISDGRTSFTRGRDRELYRVGLVTQPNKEQREFVFEVEPQQRAPEGMKGAMAQIVRFEGLGTDGERGAEVDEGEYLALEEEDRGAVDFFRKTTAGRQIRVKTEVYDLLPEEERGDKRFYRRERPRLAELEVYTLGDNAVRLTRRGLEETTTSADERRRRDFSDGLLSTFRSMREYDLLRGENQLEIDLGARYWLDRIRLLSPAEPPPAYQVRISDGSVDPSGLRVWRAFEERLNLDAYLQVEEAFSPQEVRFIEVRRLEFSAGKTEEGNLSEVQAYGEGHVAAVVMASPIIKLGRSRLLSTVTWEGEAPPKTRIEVRTRSGNELIRIPHYYDYRGVDVRIREAWERLLVERRGPIVIEELPDAGWSKWSEIYLASGERFKSPSPRRYALAEVRLISEEPLRAPWIRALQLNFDPPLVDQSFAEIWPVAGVEPGADQEFTLYMRPVFGSGNPGFDRLRLSSSSSSPIELAEVRAGREGALRAGAGEQLWPGSLQAEEREDGSVELVFPEPVIASGRIYAFRFSTELFLSNTQFSVQLKRKTRPELVQEVSEGEATGLAESQSLTVLADLEEMSLLGGVEVIPPVFTPNGDGVNDEATIEVDVFVVEGDKELRVEIFDLAGRRVRDLSRQTARPSGRQKFVWDGRNDRGRLLPPGIYAVRVGFETDAGVDGTASMRLVHVVY